MEEQYKFVKGDLKLADTPTKIDQPLSLKKAKEIVKKERKMISKLQPMLYAQHKYGVVIVLQALDAAGKDSLIAHTFSGLNPAWFDVVNFKQPSSIDLDHDFLWRINQQLPPRGMLGIFNRSYYEDVLISRVHPEILLNENLPGINNLKDLNEEFYEYRYQDIQNYENYLNHAGYVVIKIFLHISKEEQLQRFLDRINTPDKQWKFSASDVHEHKFFNQYIDAYQRAINATATEENPWYVIPADDKWNSRAIAATIIRERLEQLPLAFPEIAKEDNAKLKAATKELKKEDKH
ncbi:PPK2 family polyphosphate kinase [Limosilactobacillus equigenerosi]|uniref:Polyphosphate kinase-2-related domain-containing protein n=1 Tax=Limosilactobacillus equigenerosi DSM 18793 = JCM 14505 TaxID=1423742 RepID=A0A0R1UR10_9LACO|nr:PPK2 family polyphosphate kinase [Limosilactobacillus equigenerosi]KRL95625.1 hypothetical protein FC21_GL000729 [Limosilactobacillus equigenerosi DSM 18793 = JCM 14505]